MPQKPKYFVVEASALPEIYLKVAEAKRLLETGEAATVNAAVQMTGISRSAFYKYRDAVRPFQDMLQGRIVTIQIILRDEPGVLSTLLNLLAAKGSNILTINQGIPSGGSAAVTIGVETSGLECALEELMEAIGALDGVIRSQILAG